MGAQQDSGRRSALMRRVRQRDTAPERLVRGALHRRGLRFKVADRRLPGTPDLVFPRFGTVVFVHGCFWHGHRCRRGRMPRTNRAYWLPKIEANRRRDARKRQSLRRLGWRVLTVWQCQLEPPARAAAVLGRVAAAIRATGRGSPRRAFPLARPRWCSSRAASASAAGALAARAGRAASPRRGGRSFAAVHGRKRTRRDS